MKLNDSQWAWVHKRIKQITDPGYGEIKIKAVGDRKLYIVGGLGEEIVAEDNSQIMPVISPEITVDKNDLQNSEYVI